MKIKFIPECYADTTMTQFFLKNPDLILHQHGNTKVANSMETEASRYYRLIGIVDADKRQPLYFKDFKEKEKYGAITLKHKPNTEQYLIVVAPALERFLIECCAEQEIHLSDYNLPNDLKQLTTITKDVSIAYNHNFKRLLKSLTETQGFKTLEKFFSELQTI